MKPKGPPHRPRRPKWTSLTGGVPEQAPCPVRYIGTLKYARETGKGAFWKSALTQTIPGTWEIVDEYDQALKTFHDGYPYLICGAERSLFQMKD